MLQNLHFVKYKIYTLKCTLFVSVWVHFISMLVAMCLRYIWRKNFLDKHIFLSKIHIPCSPEFVREWKLFQIKTYRVEKKTTVLPTKINDKFVLLQDCHSSQEKPNGPPVRDEVENYTLMGGSQNDTHTVLEFRRALDTCDSEDYILSVSIY